MTTIQIKRSTTTSIPTSLSFGELAISLSGTNPLLYVGNSAGTPIIIGSTVFNSVGNLVGITQPSSDNSTKVATTAYVNQFISALGSFSYKGTLKGSLNPNFPTASVGDVWIISASGNVGKSSDKDSTSPDLVVIKGDVLLCITNSASGKYSDVGSNWIFLTRAYDSTSTVTSSSHTSTSGNLVIYGSTNGLVIQDSTYSISSGSVLSSSSTEIPTGAQVSTAIAGVQSTNYTASNGVQIVNNNISALIDDSTIKVNTEGKLYVVFADGGTF